VLNEHYEGDGDIVYQHACKLGCEGIVSKRVIAGAFGFLTFSQCGERPERYGEQYRQEFLSGTELIGSWLNRRCQTDTRSASRSPGGSPEDGSGENLETATRSPKNCRLDCLRLSAS
jgi:hypothetical protein